MPKYRVMRYAKGVWDVQEPRIVEAATARDAAEQIIGAGLVEGGSGRKSSCLREGLASPSRRAVVQ